MNIKVIRRDGVVEDFDPKKVSKVAQSAGLAPEQADSLAETVASWIEERDQPVVSSFIVRMKIVEELRKIDEHAADLYTWYGTTKDDNPRK
ncbi:ATP cone domain-containing protein [Patescibacteria group bacterium]